MTFRIISIAAVFAFALATMACDPPETDGEPGGNDGAVSEDGPDSIDHGGITEFPDDPALVEKGEDLFRTEGCAGCHQMDNDGAGPALGAVTERRSPAWIARMIMHPSDMRQSDPTAQEVSDDFVAPMPATNLEPDQAEALIAYLRAQAE